jgi:hypothetical protein
LAALGLALYLWPALAAPVVRWSDSELDLDWARRGVGIFSPVVSPHHPPKPGYILFLRAAIALGPAETEARRIVVIQSLLLWLSIGATALLVGRRVGARSGVALYVVLILFLRLRDSSSAVMSEALTAALLVPIVAVLLEPPKRIAAAAPLGIAIALLFLVRPNAGAAVLVLAFAALWPSGGRRAIVALVAGFAALLLPLWAVTHVSGDPFRGMSPAFITGSVDYSWTPQHEHPTPEPPSSEQVRSAIEGWKKTFRATGVDRSRQLAWRSFHGLLGTDFYDARWSPAYARLTTASRVISPLLILAAIAALIVAPKRGRASVLGLLLVAFLVAQSLLLGALPRLALPFVPALLLFGVVALAELGSAVRRIGGAAALALLVAAVAWQRQVLDWEWGRIESSGVRIVQTIPRAALPEKEPATLHVRIAPLLVPTNATLEVLGPSKERLWTGPFEGPFLTIPMPHALLAANRLGPIELAFVADGDYDSAHFLVFPVIPRPWAPPAFRTGSESLSPSSGVPSGSLDWWSHEGAP